jgi:hypothetical protein
MKRLIYRLFSIDTRRQLPLHDQETFPVNAASFTMGATGFAIGVMLLSLHTGHRPSKYAFVLFGPVAHGASAEEILPILQERERQCERDRQTAARHRARKKAEAQ